MDQTPSSVVPYAGPDPWAEWDLRLFRWWALLCAVVAASQIAGVVLLQRWMEWRIWVGAGAMVVAGTMMLVAAIRGSCRFAIAGGASLLGLSVFFAATDYSGIAWLPQQLLHGTAVLVAAWLAEVVLGNRRVERVHRATGALPFLLSAAAVGSMRTLSVPSQYAVSFVLTWTHAILAVIAGLVAVAALIPWRRGPNLLGVVVVFAASGIAMAILTVRYHGDLVDLAIQAGSRLYDLMLWASLALIAWFLEPARDGAPA